MVKKKFSGQTIAIIILAILLLLAITFGGVYAYYSARSNKVSGKIVMANLKISLVSDAGVSDKSELIISREENVVPGQPLGNYPLVVRNLSSVSIYLAVVYEINATTPEEMEIADEFKNSVLGLGYQYINPIYPDYSSDEDYVVTNSNWIDYVFDATEEEGRCYRCLVSMVGFEPTGDAGEGITVIGEDKLALSGAMGNEYQNAMISFTFQAYAIGTASFQFKNTTTTQEKCETIVSAIYTSQDSSFLKRG